MILAKRQISVILKMQWQIMTFVTKVELQTGGNVPQDLSDTVDVLLSQNAALDNIREALVARVRELESQEIRVQAAELLVHTDLGVTK